MFNTHLSVWFLQLVSIMCMLKNWLDNLNKLVRQVDLLEVFLSFNRKKTFFVNLIFQATLQYYLCQGTSIIYLKQIITCIFVRFLYFLNSKNVLYKIEAIHKTRLW